jgi:hypothetical protein
MIHRLAPVLGLFLVSCLAPPLPPSAAAPSGAAPAAPAAPAATGECGSFKVRSESDLDACKTKCRDQARDQQKACSGAGCQGGSGTATCLNSCDGDAKAAQQAKCYK